MEDSHRKWTQFTQPKSLISFKVYTFHYYVDGHKKKLEEQKPTKIDFMIEKIRIIG